MYIGFYNYYKQFNKNRMFLDPGSPVGEDLMYPFVYLGKYLTEKGHKINTIDMDDLNKFEAIVFFDFPGLKNKYFRQLIKNKFGNLYLVTIESPIIKPDNWDVKNHKYFKKIFCWNDDFVDNKKYFKLNIPLKMPKNLDFNTIKKQKLCTMIISNKFNPHPQQLYTERINAIRWFEKNHPEDFDLYGQGWNRYYFSGKFFGLKLARLNRLKFLAKLLKPNYSSWKGPLKSKKEILKKYKFSLCYENAKGFPGYITEKIFDCFFGGAVPVYLGASNIKEHIPENTFIDKRNFKTYEDLYSFIKEMPEKEYLGYLNSIKNYIENGRAYPFSHQCFAKTISEKIL